MRSNRLGDQLLPWAILPMAFVAVGLLVLYKGVLESRTAAAQIALHPTGPTVAASVFILLACLEDLTRRLAR